MEKKCEKCGRILTDDEEKICPACEAKSSSSKKGWFEAIATGVVAVGGIALYVLSGGKSGDANNDDKKA
jgi:reverse gyrase